MLPQITLQLYSVREQLAQDFEGTLKKIVDIGFPCVEPAGFPGSSPAEAARLFEQFSLEAPTAHSALPVGDAKNEVIETALQLGHRYLITGSPPGWRDNFNSKSDIRRIAEQYVEAADNAAEHGIRIGYHNHDWDLREIDGEPAYRIFLENTPDSIVWQADIFWVARAGLDPAEFLKEIGERGVALHFKDGHLKDREITPPFLPAGKGDVNIPAAADAAKHAHYIGVELDAYDGDMIDAVTKSYNFLTQSGIARGTK